MAYREVGMWEILEVLRRIGRGESKSAVKRATGHGRATIRRYIETAEELGWVAGLHEPDEELAADVFARLRPGRAAEPGDAERMLLPHKQQIRGWLEPEEGQRRGLRLTKVHELLRRRDVDVPYSSLHRFAVKHCGFADKRRLTVRVAECAPGELAEVDYGRLGLVPDPERGGRRTVWALCVTLVHSRHQYVHVTHSQKVPALIEGLEAAWEFFGGVPARVVLDNLKAAITKADRYDPTVQRVFEEYARYRDFIIDPAVPRHAKGKPHVERNVPYVRDNFFAGESWDDIAHVQRAATAWCLSVAGKRIHGTTRKAPLGVFENIERAALRPITKPRFDTPSWGECKVHGDHHVCFLKALYSVPTRHVGKKVWVRADSKLVRIYVDGKPVKVHERKPPGGRSTDYNDYPPERAAYAMRDPDRLIGEAKRLGENIARFMQALLAPPFPWKNLRQGQKLLRLGNKYGVGRVDAACRRALAFELINVRRVENIIERGLDREAPRDDAPAAVLQLPLRFARPATSFVHLHTEGGDHRE